MWLTDVLTVYASVVATGAALWPIYQWRHAHRDHVEVETRFAFLTMTDGGLVDTVTVTARNRGDRPVSVTSVGIDHNDGSGRSIQNIAVVPGGSLPGTVEPGHEGMTYFMADDLKREGVDLYRSVVGWVSLASRSGRIESPGREPLLKS